MIIADLTTPALIVERAALEHNLDVMARALPGEQLRPHVKAHKSTALARLQAQRGHRRFTAATVREVEGLVRAGLGTDVLLANEVLDATRLARLDARITIAVDSADTIMAAARDGMREVLIDVNVGLPRCGCDPERAGELAELARRHGLLVRGVMGYEGHAVGLPDRAHRLAETERAMRLLAQAHRAVGGEVVSAGGTGTYDMHSLATEIQAGSYLLMDTAYAKLGLPFQQAAYVLATVLSVSATHAVADCGLKSLGMDHGNPAVEGADVWFCSDEHLVFAPTDSPGKRRRRFCVGERICVWPAHVDPTMAYHERLHLVDDERVLETWPVDLRGW